MAATIIISIQFINTENPVIYKKEIPNAEEILITNDLCKISHSNLVDIFKYTNIIEIGILERILELGKYHKNYYPKGNSPVMGLNKLFEIHQIHSLSDIKNNNFHNNIFDYAIDLREKSKKQEIWKHYKEIELPFAISLSNMTSKGITIDSSRIAGITRNIHRCYDAINIYLQDYRLFGNTMKDLNSWLKDFELEDLFDTQTDVELNDLKLLENKHPVFGLFRRLEKIKRFHSLCMRIGKCERVFPEYKVVGAVTDRCTSSNPNIMGLPKEFRPVVIPSKKDYGIVECDYSQMEIGIIAALSNDNILIDDFNTGDVYSKFAGQLNLTRDMAKIIFLGLIYGIGTKTLSRWLEIDHQQTNQLLQTFFNRYYALKTFLDNQIRFGTEKGYVKSITGLKRYRKSVNLTPNGWEKNWFKNFPVQASGAAVFKKAVILIHGRLDLKKFNLLVPLYDSIVFEAQIDYIKKAIEDVKESMIEAMIHFFPQLKPRITVNDTDISCWNDEDSGTDIERFVRNPVEGIDLSKPPPGINWDDLF